MPGTGTPCLTVWQCGLPGTCQQHATEQQLDRDRATTGRWLHSSTEHWSFPWHHWYPPPPSQTSADTPNSMPDIKAAKTRKRPRRRCRDSPTLAPIGRQLQCNKRQLSPHGAQQPNDCADNDANKRRRDGDTDSCTNSSDDCYRDLDSPETGRVTISPRLLCSKVVKEHSQATGSPAMTSITELLKKQIWHLKPHKTKNPRHYKPSTQEEGQNARSRTP